MSTDQIRERLEKATEFSPTPWRGIVNTAQVRFGVLDGTGCIVDPTTHRKADFLSHSPTDIETLLAAVDAVLALLCEPDATEVPWNQPDLTPPFYSRRIREAITRALDTK